MDDFVLVKVFKCSDELVRKVEKGLLGRSSEIFVELFEGSRYILHKDPSLLWKMVMFNILYYVLM
jgi:hypothetical protein